MFHPDAWKNGATAAVAAGPGDCLGLIGIYEVFRNSYGQFWPTTNNEGNGALNIATGKKHNSLNSARAWLKRHGVIERVNPEIIRVLYKDHPTPPPPAAHVFRFTGMVKPCENKGCKCHQFIEVPTALLMMGDGGPDILPNCVIPEHEEETTKEKSVSSIQMAENGETPSAVPDSEPESDPKPAPDPKPLPNDPPKPKSKAKLDPSGIPINRDHPRWASLFDALVLVCGVDVGIPQNYKQVAAVVCQLLASPIQYTDEDVKFAPTFWNTIRKFPDGLTLFSMPKWLNSIRAARLAGGKPGRKPSRDSGPEEDLELEARSRAFIQQKMREKQEREKAKNATHLP